MEREKREKDQREKEQREKERRDKEQQEKERREKEEEEKKRQALKVGSKLPKEKSKQGKLPMPRAQGSQGSQGSSLAVKVELVDVEKSSTATASPRDIARDPRTRPSRHDPRLQHEENTETLEALNEAPVKVLVDPYLEHQPEEVTTLSVEVLSQPKAVPKQAVAKRQRKGAAPKKAIAKHPPSTPSTPMTPMTPLVPSQEKKLLEIKQLLQRETSKGPPSGPPEAGPSTPMTPAPAPEESGSFGLERQLVFF